MTKVLLPGASSLEWNKLVERYLDEISTKCPVDTRRFQGESRK